MTTKYIKSESFQVLCGKKIGRGAYREVWTCSFDDSLVVKLEKDAKDFCNIKEWENWQEHQYSDDIKEWLAPCVSISPSGGVLIQKRVDPISKREMPKKLPKFLTDLKTDNFGWYDGRVVCVDYASLICTWSSKLVKRRVYA